MITIEQVNRWQSIIRDYNKAPIPFEELASKCAKEGLEELQIYLTNNHYIAKMKDGNTFINWSNNKYYPENTIVDLKAELNNTTRPLTIEERLTILEQQVKELLERVK